MAQPSIVCKLGDHLASASLRLPLKYPSTIEVLKSHDFYRNQISHSGRLVATKSPAASHIAWLLHSDMKTITLTPLSMTNLLHLDVRKICLFLPTNVHPHCIDVHWCEYNGGCIVVDLVDENYLWITVKVALDDFFTNAKTLTLDRFEQWGHISVPYSFELRSSPYLMKVLDLNNAVVSLKDGGLLHFQRKSPLSDFNVFNCEENAHFHLGGVLDGLFRSTKTPDLTIDGVSSSAAMDAVMVPDSTTEVVATLTVNKVIKFWDLRKHALLRDRTIVLGDTGLWLSFGSAAYMQCHDNLLGVHSLQQTKQATSIHLWDVRAFDGKSYKLHKSVQLRSPQITKSTFTGSFSNDIWFIQDYAFTINDQTLTSSVLWKSNNSSILTKYEILDEPIVLEEWSLNSSDTAVTSLQDIAYFENELFNTGKYNYLILRTAMNVLREHANLDVVYGQRAIRQLILETVETVASIEDIDKRAVWLKMLSLCDQFRNTGQEGLSFADCEGNPMAIALQVDSLSLFRKPHWLQTFYLSEGNTDEGQLAAILQSVNERFSNKSRHKIYRALLYQEDISAERTTKIYEQFIQSKVAESDAIEYQNQLAHVPLEAIKAVIVAKKVDLDVHSPSETPLSALAKLDTISTFRNIKDAHEKILLDMAIVLLLFDPRRETVDLLSAIVKKLSSYEILEHIFCTSFNDEDTELEAHNLSKPENSVFWTSVADKDAVLCELILQGNMNEGFDHLAGKLEASHQEIVLNVVVELLNCGNGEAVKKSYLRIMNQNRPVDRVLIGLVYLLTDDVPNFCAIFDNYENVDNKQTVTGLQDRLNFKKEITELLHAVFGSFDNPELQKAHYFHSLYELAKSQAKSVRHRSRQNILTPNVPSANTVIETDFLTAALRFERTALEFSKVAAPSTISATDAYLNMYELGLVLQDNDAVYESLLNLTAACKDYDYGYLMKRFLSTLVSQNTLSSIFPPNKNELFRENYLLIDSVLLELANNELVLASALTFYEYLYAWRLIGASTKVDPTKLADKRGAAEALYMFITRFKLEQPDLLRTKDQEEDIRQYKLKVLELYLIILNSLQSFDDKDDQWLVKSLSNDSLAVVKLEEISVEYYSWLKEIREEL